MTITYTQAQQARWPSPPDPGGLSRRVARRRTELGLSQEQLAARSKMSTRYLEYLERYPARPSDMALRHLADALRTTPAELNRLRDDATGWPWPGGEREVYLRIVPDRITGRRICGGEGPGL
jgi:transcriptional regulator with XRE-family HTH domain